MSYKPTLPTGTHFQDSPPPTGPDGKPKRFLTIAEQDGKGSGYCTGGVGKEFTKTARTKVGNKGLSTI